MMNLSLPFPISANNAYFNRRKGGRTRTDRHNVWRQAAGWEVKRQKPDPVHGYYTLSLHLVEADNRRRDIANFEKVVSDLLVEHGLVDDDSKCVSMTISRSKGPKARCLVYAYPSNGIPEFGERDAA